MSDTSPHRRHLTRIPFDAEYRITDNTTDRPYVGHVIDLSLKGALIERPDALSVHLDDVLSLDLILGEGDLHIQMQARVAHLHEHSIGMVCEHLDLDSMTHLCRFLELNLGSHDQLERELTEMLQLNTH
ncbi:MAG: PilZ domain-containing protein [Gammaproteobacteria bacterium]|nr:PilZ domain-containing protein [Gammaproteobacteria bacterium]